MRPADESDFPALLAALRKLQGYYEANPEHYDWAPQYDWDLGTGRLQEAIRKGAGYVVDGYLVMVDMPMAWYASERVLQEWFVIRLYKGGTVDSVPLALLAIAEQHGLRLIFSADSSPVNIVGDAYARAGFKASGSNFYWNTQWASKPKT